MTRPASLLVRTTFVLALSAVAIVATAILAVNQWVIMPIARQSADDEAALLVLSAQTWVELPPEARPYFELELAENHDLILSSQVRQLRDVGDNPYLDLLAERLEARMGEPVTLRAGDDLIWANIPMGGFVMQIGFSPARHDIQPVYVALIIVAMGAGIVFLTAVLIVRRIARPLEQTAELAASFRGGESFTPLPEQGPRELVTLAQSFNTMARDIAALLSNRTTLLAGISHDLRTPLARMRLALELLPEDVDRDLIARFERNLEAMDELIGDALRFARGAGEVPVEVELKPWLESIVGGIDEAVTVTWHGEPSRRTHVAAGALRRVLQNLIANARQHGSGDPQLLVVADRDIDLHVVDAGRGIPTEFRERVLQPFFRLDKSRSRSSGGSGLGLAIVHQLCQAHGWSVGITEADGGGTDVVIRLPERQPGTASATKQNDTKSRASEIAE